jgi:hypothetical protein
MNRLLLLFLLALSLMIAPFLQGVTTILPVLSGGPTAPAEEESHEEVTELHALREERSAPPGAARLVEQRQAPPPRHPAVSLSPPRGAFINLPLPPLRLQV